MVFFPKPGLIKELGCELVGSLIVYAVIGTTVAMTGGSRAFVANGTAVALSQGFIILFIMALLPFIHYNPVYTMYMILNDLICWFRGLEGGIYILRYFLTFLMQIVAAILAALITWIYTETRGGPIHLGQPRTVADANGYHAFFALAFSSGFVGMAWLVASENATALYRYGMHWLKLSFRQQHPNGGKANTAQKNLHPGKGQMHLFIASFVRAAIVAAITVGVTYMTQPIAGYSTNPVIWLGYAIVSNHYDGTWAVQIFAPFAGGFVAYLLYLPYTFASNWTPLTRYYGRGLAKGPRIFF